MAVQNRAPTGDGTVTGTVTGSAGSRWTLVDDYPNASTSDMLTFGTATSAINFTYSAFTVPAGSTGISVQVRYVDGEAANGANNCGGRIIVGGATFNATTHNPAGTAGTLQSDNWSTNPQTTAAWTVDQVNGIGANALTGFGINSTDSNPTFNVRSIEIQVTYSPPITGDGVVAPDAVGLTATGTVAVQGTGVTTPAAVTLEATGTVADPQPPIEGAGVTAPSAVGLTATGAVLVQGAGVSAPSAVGLSAAGTVAVQGSGVSAPAAVTLSATGVVGSTPVEGVGVTAPAAVGLVATGTVASAPAAPVAQLPGVLYGEPTDEATLPGAAAGGARLTRERPTSGTIPKE